MDLRKEFEEKTKQPAIQSYDTGIHLEDRFIPEYTDWLESQLTASRTQNAELVGALEVAIPNIEYSAYNLTELQKESNLKPEIIESTCPETTLLIEIRRLKTALRSVESIDSDSNRKVVDAEQTKGGGDG